MRCLFYGILFSIFISCSGETEYWWQMDTSYDVMTPDEQINVLHAQNDILKATPSTLSGHDQDWDDAIMAAHLVACETMVRRKELEFKRKKGFAEPYEKSGRWRFFGDREIHGVRIEDASESPYKGSLPSIQ